MESEVICSVVEEMKPEELVSFIKNRSGFKNDFPCDFVDYTNTRYVGLETVHKLAESLNQAYYEYFIKYMKLYNRVDEITVTTWMKMSPTDYTRVYLMVLLDIGKFGYRVEFKSTT